MLSTALKITPWLKSRPHEKDHSTVSFGSLDERIQLLERAFGDPDRKAATQRKRRDLSNLDLILSAFIDDFVLNRQSIREAFAENEHIYL